MLIDEAKPLNLSVIIPTLNAGPEFGLLLEKLKAQSLPPFEIIVADTSSDDGTAELARAAGCKVLMVMRETFDHGGTRNFAARQAAGDALLFMTQDALPCDERLLEELAGSLADPEVAYAYARQVARPEADVLERMSREFNYPERSLRKTRADLERMGIKTFFCSNVCAAIRTDMFRKMGGFVQPTRFNEDLFLAARCVLKGYAIAYNAEAKVLHSHNYSAAQQFKRFFDNGASMSEQEWILPYTSVGKEGSRLVRAQAQALLRTGKWLRIPGLVAENAAKLIGYKLGMNYRKLPALLQRRFSMYKPKG
ncbi:glycosyltransferase family 2 protein [Paenibacillus beijingensis]|uniref:Glycosyltransferase 2-like domain-containing protein n=1 Tax=Paenibacillus beijingensis TaxID=1126833 RepID=A0A0D5NHY4_9BACL|nr:glycosyltransferase family 2 protein [Paenibacillus beijingensis]AJY74592.1 hypothetical protein VN24_08410 [Paenibacillus beijingensis]